MKADTQINVWSGSTAEQVYRGVMGSINDSEFQSTRMERMISRNGFAVRMNAMSILEFQNPAQCVIFDRIRNCNPALHLAEAMWMLAGRNDLKFITQFTPSMEGYSDDGSTLHSAYGHRWRNHFDVDQLKDVVENLKRDTSSRRELIVMWDPRSDVHAKNNGGKDLSCNFAMKFAQRNGKLNLTVFNRSNDSVFGCPGGANSVHFAFAQMFVAACVGLPVGTYTQAADDLHIYGGDVYRGLAKTLLVSSETEAGPSVKVNLDEGRDLYGSGSVITYLRNNVFENLSYESGMSEIEELVESNGESDPSIGFLSDVVKPVILGYTKFFKQENDPEKARYLVDKRIEIIGPVDWLVSCSEWFDRIIQNRKAK